MKYTDFGDTLREWRLEKGLSLGFLAEKCGLDKTTLSKYENNERQITIEALEVIVGSVGDEPEEVLLRYLRRRYPNSNILAGNN